MTQVNFNEKEKSFTELYLKYYDPIYNYIFRNVFNKEIAEDIISNTFFNALNYIKKKNPKIDNFNAWIYRIATNEILQYKKRLKKKNTLTLEEERIELQKFPESDILNNLESYNDFIILHDELKNLKPVEKALITLHFFENKNYSEISEVLNIRENTLRPMMSRTLKKLQKKLKGKLINYIAPILMIFNLNI
jgi:RNA polymerase sigma-70 factor, ECF subfamily